MSVTRVCIVCKKKYIRTELTQKVCSVACALQRVNKTNQEEFARHTRDLKRKYYDTDRKHLTKKAQVVFNRYIRLRDEEQGCISCGKRNDGKMDAGHYKARGSYPSLRFEPLNCHMQCVQCNKFQSGNLANYRLRLIDKVGLAKVEWLEGQHPQRLPAIEELKEIYKYYVDLIKAC